MSGRNWLVALEESSYSPATFQFACSRICPETDHLFLLAVVEEPSLIWQAVQNTREVMKQQRRDIKQMLSFYWRQARDRNINCTMIVGQHRHAGMSICEVAECFFINIVLVGRRVMSETKRILVGSTSRHVVENCDCDVVVLKEAQEEAEGLKLKSEMKRFHAKRTNKTLINRDNLVAEVRDLKGSEDALPKDHAFMFFFYAPDHISKKEVSITRSEELRSESGEATTPLTEEKLTPTKSDKKRKEDRPTAYVGAKLSKPFSKKSTSATKEKVAKKKRGEGVEEGLEGQKATVE